WEWDYLCAKNRSDGMTYVGLSAPVGFIDASADGKLIAATSGSYSNRENRKTAVWDASTGRQLWAYPESGQGLKPVFSPASQQLLIAGHGNPTLHNARTGEVLKRFPIRHLLSNWGGAFSPDGKSVATPNGYGLTLFDVETDKSLDFDVDKTSRGVYAISFRSDGDCIAAATRKGGVLIFDSKTAQQMQALETPSDTRFVEFSPNGELIVASGYTGKGQGFLRTWKRGEDGYEVSDTRFDRSGARTGFRFSPDGQCIAVWTGTSPVRLLSPYDLHEYNAYPVHQYTQAVAFGPHSDTLLTVGLERIIRVRKRVDESRGALGRRDGAYATDFSIQPVSGFAAVAADENPFGRSYSNAVEVMDLDRSRRSRVFMGHTDAVTCNAYDESGDLLVTGSDDTTVRVWKAQQSKTLLKIEIHEKPIVGVHFLDGDIGQHVVAIDEAGVVSVHETESGELLNGHLTEIVKATHTVVCEGRLFVSTDFGEVFGVNLATGGSQLLLKRMGSVKCLDVNPDGTHICVASEDGTIGSWQLTENGAVKIWENTIHAGAAFSVAFHPDGTRLVTTGADGFIRILESMNGTELLSLKTATYPGPVYRAKFDAASNRLIATTRSVLYSWDGTSSKTTVPADVQQETLATWHRNTARECEANENWLGAVGHWQHALDRTTTGWRCHIFQARCYEQLENWSAAKACYVSALELAESYSGEKGWNAFRAGAQNELAYFLATCPDLSFRSGREAVRYATAALKHRPQTATYLKTMAAALIETQRANALRP
ncbi:MAG: hypothetical protein AB8G99_16830, partial [Planctomycetaceae bacterium]